MIVEPALRRMPRLVLINGAPASGKSTLARRYVEEHPLALALDVDTVRAMLGGWLDQWPAAGVAARRLALAMARVHLTSGWDVVVPQYLGRLEFILDLEALAGRVGAQFVEIALVSNAQDVLARFARRVERPENDEHRDAAALQGVLGGQDALVQMYERMLEVMRARPAMRPVETVDGEIDATYRRLLEQLRR